MRGSMVRAPRASAGWTRGTVSSPLLISLAVALLAGACGDDDAEADELGVGAECAGDDDCGPEQTCLSFKGGYCGLEGCAANADCPQGSLCVAHDDGKNYCFRICLDKAECNRNRSAELEANCSSSIVFVEPQTGVKACVPPSSDTTNGADAGTGAQADAGDKKK